MSKEHSYQTAFETCFPSSNTLESMHVELHALARECDELRTNIVHHCRQAQKDFKTIENDFTQGYYFDTNPNSYTSVYNTPTLIASLMARREVFWKLCRAYLGQDATKQMAQLVKSYFEESK
jgi:hypothetical protein